MKSRPEYRKATLSFARKNGFDRVHFHGIMDGYEVYTGDYRIPKVVGLPEVILADEKGAVFAREQDPLTILSSCRKLPKVVFEYDHMCWFGNSCNLKLLADGRFIKHEYGYSKLGPQDRMTDDKETELLNSPELVKAVKDVIRENREELKKFPGHLENLGVLDGAEEKIKLGGFVFKGRNILTYSMEGYKERLKLYGSEEQKWMEDLLLFQRVFRKITDRINEFVQVNIP